MNYLDKLNDSQRQAVLYIDGPSMVIAGAGSGKTRVLTHKVVHLLHSGYNPSEIMVLTFTNKAANEMKERIEKMIGHEKANGLWMGTFHSIFARILRKEAHRLGYPNNFTIYDTVDSKNTIKQIIKHLNLDPQTYQPNKIFGRISKAKNNLITPEYYISNPEFKRLDQIAKIPMFGEIFLRYQNNLKQAGAMDFDDLLLNTNILFRNFPDILQFYQQYFKFILVDEYQDTNYSQYLIIKKLAQKHRKICVVGDDAQSIYAFRGARIENIFNFQKDFPEHKLFKLEQNYRSTQKIVQAANSIIKKNKFQIPKNVFSTAEPGEDILIVNHPTDYEEGRWVAEKIKQIHQNNVPYSDIAILYRTNAQSRIFEDFLRKNNIPYKIYGSISFYQRKEIKDLVAYLRLIINPADNEALRRIFNYPARGIGQKTQQLIFNYAQQNNLPIWNVLLSIESIPLNANPRALHAAIKFRNLIQDFQNKAKSLELYDLTKYVAEKSGLINEFSKDNSVENLSRLENIKEFLNAVKEYSETALEQTPTLDDFLQQITLLTSEDIDSEQEKLLDKVNVMTIHAAKGLEFHTVFLVGIEDGLFPSELSKTDPKDLEEERRLFYVAITRAKKQIFISYAERRLHWGKLSDQKPSPFIKELDQSLVKYLLYQNNYKPLSKPVTATNAVSYDDFIADNNLKTHPPAKNYKPDPSKLKKISSSPQSDQQKIQYDPHSGLKIGMTVFHSRFGKGKVLSIYGNYPDTKAEILFEQFGTKKMLLKFAKLKILD